MEIIEHDEYNIQYEIQFIDLMVRVLKPSIRFKFNKDGELDIFKKGTGLLIEEKITTKEFINFIQYTFPEILQEELKKISEEQSVEALKKEVFIKHINGSKKYLYLVKKHKNLHETTGMILGKLGKIKDVLQFLENLQYSNSI